MNRRLKRKVEVILCALTALPLAAGCDESSDERAVARSVPSPEASFDVIIATFKRRVETAKGGFIAPQGSGHSRLIASNSVTSRLIPPAKEGDPYRATVTVTSRSSYSMRRSDDELDRHQRGDDQYDRSGGSLDDPGSIGGGVEILDPGLVNPAAGDGDTRRAAPDASDGIVLRRPNIEEEQNFHLEYRNGRWVLLTKPDPDTQRAIKSAFDEALATQI